MPTTTRALNPAIREVTLAIAKCERDLRRLRRDMVRPMVSDIALELGGVATEVDWPPAQAGPRGVRLRVDL